MESLCAYFLELKYEHFKYLPINFDFYMSKSYRVEIKYFTLLLSTLNYTHTNDLI